MYNVIEKGRIKKSGRYDKNMKKQLKMLIVDDMEVNRVSFRKMFEDEYQILEAEDGQAAMALMGKKKVDIVILDLFMPVKNGFEVIREMKQNERLSDILIVVKTAVDENTELQALEMGADEYIFAPSEPVIIKKRIHNIVQKYILEKEKMEKKLEKEKQRSRTKELFLARMSHELRTPIGGILGITQLAHYKDARVQADFKKIRTQAEYLQELVNDVLDIAAIDNHKLTLHNSVFSLNSVISDISDLFFVQCREKRIKFNFQVNNITHEYLVGDEVRLKQILTNLLSNAFKFTDYGGKIDVCLAETDLECRKTELHITVSDSGCGISEEIQKRMWKPFEQEKHSNGRNYGGSGLGLPITKSIVQCMGGTIEVFSKKNVGTKFEVKIPMEIGMNTVREKRKFNTLRALLVNYDEIAQNYLMSLLARLGIRYDSVAEHEKITEKLKEAYEKGEGYDICFIYWQIPDGYGHAITEKIREQFDHDTLKIVTSSYNAGGFESEMRAAGADYILRKPVLQSQVYNLMSEICRIPETDGDIFRDYDFSGKKILLAEDNAVNAEVLTGFLKAVNLEVDCAANGKAAVKAYHGKEDFYYDAVLLDINMPIMGGYEAAKKIRKSNKPDAADIPVIAVTANAFAEDAVKIHKAGMNTGIVKPVSPQILYQTLEKYI